MAWIPVTAAGIINGIGHYWGYRNFASADASTNIVPWGILIGGEELHNNHHAYGTSAKLSSRWYEFDLGWTYIRILETLGLASVRKVAPKLQGRARRQAGARRRDAAGGDREPLRGRHRLRADAEGDLRGRARPAARARGPRRVRRRAEHAPAQALAVAGDAVTALRERERATLAKAMEKSNALSTIYAMRQELERAVGALDRVERAAARPAAGLVPARRSLGHRAARAVLAAAQALRIAEARAGRRAAARCKKPADRRAFFSVPRGGPARITASR